MKSLESVFMFGSSGVDAAAQSSPELPNINTLSNDFNLDKRASLATPESSTSPHRLLAAGDHKDEEEKIMLMEKKMREVRHSQYQSSVDKSVSYLTNRSHSQVSAMRITLPEQQ